MKKKIGIVILLCIVGLIAERVEGQCFGKQWFEVEVDRILSGPEYSTSIFAMYILTPSLLEEEWEVFLSFLGRRLMEPASNTKLFTVGALYDVVGGAEEVDTLRFATPLQLQEHTVNGTTTKQLCLQAKGDPSIGLEQFEAVAKALQARGIHSVNGLSLDTGLFVGPPFPDSWQWMDIVAPYGAHPVAAMVDENAFSVTVKPSTTVGKPPLLSWSSSAVQQSVSVVNQATTGPQGTVNTFNIGYALGSTGLLLTGSLPADTASASYGFAAANATDFFGRMLRSSLQISGNITFSETEEIGTCLFDDDISTLEFIESDPLTLLLNYTLQYSDNLYAEAFVRLLGTGEASVLASTSLDAGLAIISDVLTNMGVAQNGATWKQADGSGVSRFNLISPISLAQLLKALHVRADGALFQSYLPIAGETGTLKSRFQGTVAQGRVHAKTGTITGVSTLSGYAYSTSWGSEQPIIFSIMANHSPQHASVIRAAIDQIVLLLFSINSIDC